MRGMRLIEGGVTLMGSDRFYPEEAPVRRVRVDAFWIDETPVTNAQFLRFVEATGHVTHAERVPDAVLYPGVPAELCLAGSLVFVAPDDANPHWWRFVPGANWRCPRGPGSGIEGLLDHPAVHIALVDAEAYAAWAGKALPSEAEWEYAARGGLADADYAWGGELNKGGRYWANTWQGEFPWDNQELDGYRYTSPVRAFPPNGFGLHDMIGNVWEWTADWYAEATRLHQAKACPACVPLNPAGGLEQDSLDPLAAHPVGRKVIKGGSHLCAPNYCQRYRPAARQPQGIDTTTSHVGFRCVARP